MALIDTPRWARGAWFVSQRPRALRAGSCDVSVSRMIVSDATRFSVSERSFRREERPVICLASRRRRRRRRRRSASSSSFACHLASRVVFVFVPRRRRRLWPDIAAFSSLGVVASRRCRARRRRVLLVARKVRRPSVLGRAAAQEKTPIPGLGWHAFRVRHHELPCTATRLYYYIVLYKPSPLRTTGGESSALHAR